VSLTDAGLGFHLTYLADCGYITVTRARELPSWRTSSPQRSPRMLRRRQKHCRRRRRSNRSRSR
jgi:hypothetical protein